MSKHLGYVRVSTVEQNTERQLEGVTLDKVFEDKCSGKDTERPQLRLLLDYVREGDTIHVHDISRLARNLKDLLEIVDGLGKQGVSLQFHKENLSFTGEDNPMQELMMNVMGAVAQFERSMILERQREGIALAKAKGVYKGRKASVDTQAILAELEAGLSIRRTAAKLGVGVSTVQRVKTSVSS